MVRVAPEEFSLGQREALGRDLSLWPLPPKDAGKDRPKDRLAWPIGLLRTGGKEARAASWTGKEAYRGMGSQPLEEPHCMY